jgi:SAM-dependent methyltransferase
MAIAINRAAARNLRSRFDEALDLVRNEFHGLDRDQQYHNAFARLLKLDPLDRVLMMGTDQRDQFVPELRAAISRSLPRAGHILDIGAGNGQTFELIADTVPNETTVSFIEPNAHYVDDYRAMLRRLPNLKSGCSVATGFEGIDGVVPRSGIDLPSDQSIDLVMALQMIFFLEDLPTSFTRMARFLRPGGELFVVFADETDGYTGVALRAYIAEGGHVGNNEQHLAAIAERRRLFSGAALGGNSAILSILRERLPDCDFSLTTMRQPTRLYGHSISDLIAMANIAILSSVTDLSKFDAASRVLQTDPESVDLRIEQDGPRQGMWSVLQPQLVAVVRRLR